ncbi:HlyD family efflux transporter periplasmic adaptor subunit [Chitinivorax sp. PXF-14]|uniref:efflux RND transporter periplasmic adaptor subunit n=1 Tax=Chitinivorax sp. PXF-14 TaxID=3230488 RepID=UPI003465CB35
MRLRAHLGFVLLALIVLGGLAFGFFPRAIEVETVAATRGPLQVMVEEEGKTRVRERYLISAPVAGHARRIALKVGDSIIAGQAVAEIEPARSVALDPRAHAQATATVKAAEATLDAARESVRVAAASAELARLEVARNEALFRQQFVSRQALDAAQAEQRRTRAAQLSAEHAATAASFDLERARAALQATSRVPGMAADVLAVRTPIDGRVLKVIHESEGDVPPGGALIELGDSGSLEIEVEVLSSQAVRITPGNPVRLDRWGGDSALQGLVRVVEPTGFTKVSALGVEEQRVRVIVDLTSPREAWRRLGDGYRVEARFIVWEGQDVLQIPASALFRQQGGWAVFAVEAGRARLRQVVIGQQSGLQVQVTSGLKAGDVLVSHPDDKVSDGVRVKAR